MRKIKIQKLIALCSFLLLVIFTACKNPTLSAPPKVESSTPETTSPQNPPSTTPPVTTTPITLTKIDRFGSNSKINVLSVQDAVTNEWVVTVIVYENQSTYNTPTVDIPLNFTFSGLLENKPVVINSVNDGTNLSLSSVNASATQSIVRLVHTGVGTEISSTGSIVLNVGNSTTNDYSGAPIKVTVNSKRVYNPGVVEVKSLSMNPADANVTIANQEETYTLTINDNQYSYKNDTYTINLQMPLSNMVAESPITITPQIKEGHPVEVKNISVSKTGVVSFSIVYKGNGTQKGTQSTISLILGAQNTTDYKELPIITINVNRITDFITINKKVFTETVKAKSFSGRESQGNSEKLSTFTFSDDGLTITKKTENTLLGTTTLNTYEFDSASSETQSKYTSNNVTKAIIIDTDSIKVDGQKYEQNYVDNGPLLSDTLKGLTYSRSEIIDGSLVIHKYTFDDNGKTITYTKKVGECDKVIVLGYPKELTSTDNVSAVFGTAENTLSVSLLGDELITNINDVPFILGKTNFDVDSIVFEAVDVTSIISNKDSADIEKQDSNWNIEIIDDVRTYNQDLFEIPLTINLSNVVTGYPLSVVIQNNKGVTTSTPILDGSVLTTTLTHTNGGNSYGMVEFVLSGGKYEQDTIIEISTKRNPDYNAIYSELFEAALKNKSFKAREDVGSSEKLVMYTFSETGAELKRSITTWPATNIVYADTIQLDSASSPTSAIFGGKNISIVDGGITIDAVKYYSDFADPGPLFVDRVKNKTFKWRSTSAGSSEWLHTYSFDAQGKMKYTKTLWRGSPTTVTSSQIITTDSRTSAKYGPTSITFVDNNTVKINNIDYKTNFDDMGPQFVDRVKGKTFVENENWKYEFSSDGNKITIYSWTRDGLVWKPYYWKKKDTNTVHQRNANTYEGAYEHGVGYYAMQLSNNDATLKFSSIYLASLNQGASWKDSATLQQ